MILKSTFSSKWAVQRMRHGLFLILAIYANSSFAVSEAVSDVRVVIDISGSMKKNDPQNLRSPAIRMLVGLMPHNAKSGIWTFGKYTNMQVKHGKVTSSWKKLAMAESKKIHSRGLFTNIEDALKKSTRGWDKPNRKEQRHLILLTDGMVDVSKDAKQNEASRKRILNTIAPQLKKSGVSIHTVALSSNADKKLMSALSGMTDGWHEAVDNAEDLQRVFLHIFEKSANVDTVPLKNNNFSIDKSIKDMTVLVFRKPNSSETKLVTPSKKNWSYKNHPKNVTWHQDTGYDLISSRDPEVGKWLINAAIDPDNRVMVVTNLKLVTGNFPNNIMYGDTLSLTAKLVQEGKTVTQERLLKLVKFNVVKHIKAEPTSSGNGDIKSQTPMIDDGSASDRLGGDGVYTVAFNTDQTSGDVTLVMQAKSPAFEREVRHIIKIHDTPADLNISKQADGKFNLTVKPRMELLIPHTVSVQVKLPDGSKKTLEQDDDDNWKVIISKEYTGKKVTVSLVGTRVNDKPFHVDFDKVLTVSTGAEQHLSLDTQVALAPVAPPAVKSDSSDHHAPPPPAIPDVDAPKPASDKPEVKDAHADKAKHGDESSKDAAGFDFLSTTMIIIYANILLLIVGGVGYLVWRKRKRLAEKETEEMNL